MSSRNTGWRTGYDEQRRRGARSERERERGRERGGMGSEWGWEFVTMNTEGNEL